MSLNEPKNNQGKDEEEFFLATCLGCGKTYKVRGKEGEKGFCEACFSNKTSRARCQCGAIHEVPGNNISFLHKGITASPLDPGESIFFLINVCPTCDPGEKLTDIGSTLYRLT